MHGQCSHQCNLKVLRANNGRRRSVGSLNMQARAECNKTAQQPRRNQMFNAKPAQTGRLRGEQDLWSMSPQNPKHRTPTQVNVIMPCKHDWRLSTKQVVVYELASTRTYSDPTSWHKQVVGEPRIAVQPLRLIDPCFCIQEQERARQSAV